MRDSSRSCALDHAISGGKSGGRMAKNKLTATEIRKATGKNFDGGELYLTKPNPDSGRWTYRYKFKGRSREMGLGSFPNVTLSDARQARDKWEAVHRRRRTTESEYLKP